MLKKILYKWLLPKLIKKRCNSRIPRSGEEGEKVNCFVIALDSGKSPFFISTEYKDDELLGIKWNGRKYEEEYSIKILDIDNYDFRVTHYYGLTNINYDSIYSIAWNYITKQIYIKINLYRKLSSINQYFFNKKKFITKKRMELLQFMLDNQLDSEQNKIEIIDLMTQLYSIRWVSHPSADDQMRKLEIYLESLVETGDLKYIDNYYTVTGKAISTLEYYEKEEQRHISKVKIQRRMFWLTVILVFIGLIQSELLKLPTIFDFSGK